MENPRAPRESASAPERLREYRDGTEVSARDHRHLSGPEHEARREVVRQLVALGVTSDQLPKAMAGEGWPMSRAVARQEYDAVMAEWVADHAHLRESTRAAQIQRLNSDLARYRASPNRWQAVVQTEALLARVCGHLAPVKHEVTVEAHVTVREAMAEVAGGLTAEDIDRILAEEAELELLAAEARRDRSALLVRGEPVPAE